MPYNRIVEIYDTDAVTLLSTISNGSTSTVKDCSFELLRKTGCGSGSLTITNPFTQRNLTVGQHVKIYYDVGDPWYFARIEEIEWTSPSEASIRMFGLFSYLNDIQLGGYGPFDVRKPERYGKTDYFVNDPDHHLQTHYSASQPHQIINHFYNNYINPESPVGLGTVEEPDVATSFESFTFRGEENLSQVIRSVGMIQRDASFGVDENGDFFFINKRDYEPALKTYQEGVDVRELRMSVDRSLQFNQILMVGDLIYGADTPAGFYRYVARLQHNPSVSAFGYRTFRLYVPWIRTDQDAVRFAQGFFDNYAGLTTRYSFKTIGQDTLLKPWDGRIQLKDASGTVLATSVFDRIQVDFNEVPVFTVTLGPEEPQFPEPPEPQRWEQPESNEPGDKPQQEHSLSVPFTWTESTAQESSASSAVESSSNRTVCRTKIGGKKLDYFEFYNAGVVQVLGHDADGCARWYNVEECTSGSAT